MCHPTCRISTDAAPVSHNCPQDSQAGRKSRKKRKDPNAPKRATNAYMILSDTQYAANEHVSPGMHRTGPSR